MGETSPLVRLEKLGCQGFVPGARRCTTGAALFQRAGRYNAGTAACDDSFSVEIPISAMVGVTSFCHEGASCGGSWLQNFDVILVPNLYLTVSLCCYLTPFDLW